MTNLNEIEIEVMERGSNGWESMLGNFVKQWEMTEDEINDVIDGKTVKVIAPNGRRVIWMTRK